LPFVPGIPDLDLWEGVLYRLDVCYNFQVGDLVLWYIKALQYLEYDYRRTRPYNSQGVQFENSQGVLKIYDKERERRDKHDLIGALLAHGYLRLEYEMWRKTIQRLTGEKRPTLRNITVSLLLDVLENELRNLELLGRSIGTVNTTFKVLLEKYGKWEALALISLLTLKMEYPSLELLAGDAGLHPNSINRHIQKKFIENGLPPTLTEYSEPLPPLIIDREFVISQSRKEESIEEGGFNV
jgi:hypothetical protein